ncbi:RNA polymerase factor sigma-54 [bacterium]|nr:RNA polymerase factor sigma-54 [bacterium]
MQLRQDMRLRQEQILQPQQILRSELIQLPQLLLEARFQQEFEQNPMLEMMEEQELDQNEPEENLLESSTISEAEKESEDSEARDSEREESEVDWESVLNDEEDQQRYRSNQAITEPVEIPQAATVSLMELLTEQLRYESFTDEQFEIGDYIIGSLDRRGYLNTDVELIADMTNSKVEEVEHVLHTIQRFDPAGIASRDLRECLMVQLEVTAESDTLAYNILDKFYEDFKNRRFESIAEKLDESVGRVQEAFNAITKLNPFPGEGVINEKLNYVIPDLVVEEYDDEFLVTLNDGNIPSFYINEDLKKLILSRQKDDKKAREFAIHKAESARWFINAIVQRRTTMIRTMRAIVERQIDWFKSGKESDLKPMILNDIAEVINMDISTISRVTREKYVQTPYGVFELKYFFNDSMSTASGDVATPTIKSKLKQIIDAENKAKPLSDQAIAGKLADVGYPIARRTVQKYREQLGIPVKRLRRQIT